MLKEFAPAKINLSLHVTGQRSDGYHLLDSFVVFASVGDHLSITTDDTLSLTINGPEQSGVPIAGNSIVSAAQFVNPDITARMELYKSLPTASGIGGGTADAAAAYRGISRLLDHPPLTATRDLFSKVAQLGADVPVCLFSKNSRMSGIGESVEFLPNLPVLNAVLVNPRIEVPTPAVFKSIRSKNNAPMGKIPSNFANAKGLIDWLRLQRNDMQEAASSIAPIVSEVLSKIELTSGCQLSRMSGSGATCFGLYPSSSSAERAAKSLAKQHPEWWIQSCTFADEYLVET